MPLLSTYYSFPCCSAVSCGLVDYDFAQIATVGIGRLVVTGGQTLSMEITPFPFIDSELVGIKNNKSLAFLAAVRV